MKQIFQEDKDLVHEFVQNDGLSCLIKVGSEADQNYQNYILRALGQVMLYVDGMNGKLYNCPYISARLQTAVIGQKSSFLACWFFL